MNIKQTLQASIAQEPMPKTPKPPEIYQAALNEIERLEGRIKKANLAAIKLRPVMTRGIKSTPDALNVNEFKKLLTP